MVDRLVKIDSGLNRVLETRDDQGRGGGQQQEDDEKDKKKKDKFDKGKPFWKRLIPDAEGQPGRSARARLASGEKPNPLQLRQDALLGKSSDEDVTDEEEMSITLSRRILVLWGVVDLDGKPRIQVIITYAVVAAVIAVSMILIFGILFRGT
ncbi:MAG TPA: hypothetical protein VLJ37_07575 [bacterium]|nr:hypothetical protein [bacterium]